MSMSVSSPRSNELLPDYSPATSGSAGLPQYSLKPHPSEFVLDIDIVCFCNKVGGRYTYDSPDMTVNLGSRFWGLETPSYGSEGVIKGHIIIKDKSIPNATCLLASLIITTLGPGKKSKKLWSQKSEVRNLAKQPYQSGEEVSFEFPIPSEIKVDDRSILSPPSLLVKVKDTKIVVDYRLVITLEKKGILQSTSSLKIPVLYLPKTRPSDIPRNEIPIADCVGQPYTNDADIYTTRVEFDGFSKAREPTPPALEIYYSRPMVDSFASGSSVPIVLTIKNVIADDPKDYLRHFAQSTSMALYKRIRIGGTSQLTKVASVPVLTTRNLGADTYQVYGNLEAGCEGCESSWSILDIVEAQYMIFLQLHPQTGCPVSIPRFSHKDIVKLTTDPWGTNNYELNSTSGLPVPALGLTTTHSCAFCRSPATRERLELSNEPSDETGFTPKVLT